MMRIGTPCCTKRLGLFAAAPEDEGIAALEPQHPFAGARQIDQPQRDVALFGDGLPPRLPASICSACGAQSRIASCTSAS